MEMKMKKYYLLGVGIFLLLFAASAAAAEGEAELFAVEPEAELSCTEAEMESSGCTAEKDCPYDETISCVGTYQCLVYANGIKCDGVFTPCQCSAAPSGCLDPICYCDCMEAGAPRCIRECCIDWPEWP
jgi:hypothetical protein